MPPFAWAISDAAAGNARQAVALAAAFGLPFETLTLQPAVPWRWLAPRRIPGARQAFGSDFAARLRGPLPALVIGCGRQAALATRLLRAAGDGRCRAVQILDPRIDPRHWDAVVAPAHDRLQGGNVVTTLGSLNPIDDAWLATGRAAFPALGALPGPRTVLLLGGPTRAAPLGPDHWNDMATHLDGWLAADGGSLLVTSSRRTPAWLVDAVRRRYAGHPGLQWHGAGEGPNPYAGLLGWADRIVASADSVNLISEACATDVPVLAPPPASAASRLGRFHRALHERGRLRLLSARFEPWRCAPLREAVVVAAELRRRWGG
jgi:uncharacterized protein